MEIGGFVKKRFEVPRNKSGLRSENMWVEITEIDGDRISGTLANDPAVLTYMELGCPIDMTADEVIEYLPPPQKH